MGEDHTVYSHVTSYLDVFPPHSPLTEAGSDYMSVSVDLIFSAGTTSQTVMIMTSTDSTVENEETFTLSLTYTDSAVMPQSSTSTVTIIDTTGEYIHSHSMISSMTNMSLLFPLPSLPLPSLPLPLAIPPALLSSQR